MSKAAHYDDVQPATRDQWRAWLAAHHADCPGVWCVFLKASAGGPDVSYDEAVEEAICFGWVDSLPRRLDEARHKLLFTPRKPKSGWSRPNKLRVERAMEAGLMTPAGLAVIEAAKRDGSWSMLDDVEAGVVPADLAAALDGRPPARANFDAFPRSVRRGILEWIAQAKRDVTRQKRVAETAELARENERANQWRR